MCTPKATIIVIIQMYIINKFKVTFVIYMCIL